MPYKDYDKQKECTRRNSKRRWAEKHAGTLVTPEGTCNRYPDCTRPVPEGRKICDRCCALSKKYKSVSRAKAKPEGCCSNSDCFNKVVDGFKLCKHCRDRGSVYLRKERVSVRKEVLDHYGRKCVCCGTTYEEFLSIDHIGGKHLSLDGKKRGSYLYKWLIAHNFPEGYRTLCYMCNLSLGHHGSCPHSNLTQEKRVGRPNLGKAPKYTIDYQRNKVAKQREAIRAHYGGKCQCCGESTPQFLQIDHIDGGGTKHVRSLNKSMSLYDWVQRNNYPDTVRLLCTNCNVALGLYGRCPHDPPAIPTP